MNTSSNGPSGYYHAVTAEDERLKAVLAAIHDDELAGRLSTRDAADARISALEVHLDKLQALRRQFFGE